MRRAAALGLLLAALPPAAQAQDLPPFDIGLTEACLAGSPMDAACAGVAAGACMQDPLGQSTYGMGYCLDRELVWWDGRLNDAYAAARLRLSRMDEDRMEGAPAAAEMLREMQRAWIPFRDARCDFERSLWGGGTGGGPATLACLLDETARQTITIEQTSGW